MDIVCAIPVRQVKFYKLQVLQTIRKPFATSLPQYSGMSVLIFCVKKEMPLLMEFGATLSAVLPFFTKNFPA